MRISRSAIPRITCLFVLGLFLMVPHSASATVIFLTSGTSWSVPSDWNSSNNTIEVIGGGGGGANAASSQPGGGGGGGAYSKRTNVALSSGSTVAVAVGTAGAIGTTGGDTYVCNSTSNCGSINGSAVQVGAKGGGGASGGTAGSGGAAGSGFGDTTYSGGSGQTKGASGNDNGGGGGGAAGPNGAGGTAVSSTGGNGGNGSGGAGALCCEGAAGSNGTEWDATHGSGGGGGSGANNNGGGGTIHAGAGGNYGGAGGGGGFGVSGSGNGGAGKQGIIVVTYSPRIGLIKPPNNLGLVGYWKFDEGMGTVATDFSGRGNHGTLGGTLPTWTSGKLGKALNFDGSTSQVSIPDSSSIRVVSGDFTVSTWIKIDAFTYFGQIFDKGNSGTTRELHFAINSATDGWYALGEAGSSGSPMTFDVPWTTGEWQLLTWTRSGSNNTIYRNGVVTETFTNSNTVAQAQPLVLAVNSSGSGSAFDGSLDEFRLYNRALSAAEIAKLYGSGAVTFGNNSAELTRGSSLANGLVGLWTFDGLDTLTSITDRSGQSNHGYFRGGATSSAKTSGQLGQAMNFNGSSQYVDTNANDNSALDIPGAISISAWVKLSTTPSSAFWDITSNFDVSGTIAQYELAVAESNFALCAGGGGVFQCDYATGLVPSAGRWYHVVAVREAANITTTIYIDGAPLSTTRFFGTVTIPTSGFGDTIIGACCQGTLQYFPGSIDDARIYNRVLTPAEVKQLYKLGQAQIVQ